MILAANQAAARDALSPLPYLAQAAPIALRFSAARPPTPPPPHPAPKPPAEPPDSDSDEDSSPSYTPTDPASSAPGPGPGPATPANPAPADATAAPHGGLPILPDDYARPAPVTVEQLLPYFVPAPPPASRATYEIR